MSECAYAVVTSNRNQPRIFSDAFATVAGRRGLGGALILDYEKRKGEFSLDWGTGKRKVDIVNRIFFFGRLEGEGDSIFKIRRME